MFCQLQDQLHANEDFVCWYGQYVLILFVFEEVMPYYLTICSHSLHFLKGSFITFNSVGCEIVQFDFLCVMYLGLTACMLNAVVHHCYFQLWDHQSCGIMHSSAVWTVTLAARISGCICLLASSGQCLCELNLTERDLNPILGVYIYTRYNTDNRITATWCVDTTAEIPATICFVIKRSK